MMTCSGRTTKIRPPKYAFKAWKFPLYGSVSICKQYVKVLLSKYYYTSCFSPSYYSVYIYCIVIVVFILVCIQTLQSDWLMEPPLTRVVWRCTTADSGVLYATTGGALKTLTWRVDSSVIPTPSRHTPTLISGQERAQYGWTMFIVRATRLILGTVPLLDGANTTVVITRTLELPVPIVSTCVQVNTPQGCLGWGESPPSGTGFALGCNPVPYNLGTRSVGGR